jgi:Zn-dependent metalloprotease
MRRVFCLGILIAFLAVSLAQSDMIDAAAEKNFVAGTAAQSGEDVRGRRVGLPDYDIRQELADQRAVEENDLQDTAQNDVARARLEAVERFRAGLKPSAREHLRVELGRSGVPKIFFNYESPLSAPRPGSADRIARAFLTAHADIFGLTPQDVRSLRLEVKDADEGVTFLKYQQTAHGVKVFEGLITVAVSAAGEVLSVNAGAVIPDAKVLATPGLPEEQALGKAFEHAGRTAPPFLQLVEPAQTPADTSRYANPLGAEREQVLSDLRVMLVGDKPVLTWHSYVDVGPGEWYEICVDADTGELLLRHNLYIDAQGTVYTQHPGAGGRTLVSFPTSWLGGSTVTTGNNVDAYLDTDGNNVPDPINTGCLSNGRAFSPTQDFTFPFTTGVDPRTQPCPIVTNLFYFVNIAHDFHHGLGFTAAAGNFEGTDRVLAEAQDPAVVNNANMATPPDGQSPRMQMGIFTQNTSSLADDRDSSLDGDIVHHEYGHGVSNRLVGGPQNTTCLSGVQSGALGEGWSDYWAITFYNNGAVGDYSTGNPNGIRRAKYAVPAASVHDSYADLGVGGFQVHRDGEVWAATLWDLRTQLGSSKTNRLVEQGMKYTTCSPSFLNARDGILQADQNLNGGANVCKIWTVFAGHGMGSGASGNDGTTHNASSTIPASCTPVYEGELEQVDCSQIKGWLYDKNNPNTTVNVDIYDGSTRIATVPASIFRQDLLEAGKGNGAHGFVLNTPSSLKDGRWHHITARPAGTGITLPADEGDVICGASLLTTQIPQATASGDGRTWEQGTRFSSAAVGHVTHVCFYKAAGETGTHTGRLWSNTGGSLTSATFLNETASGWQCQKLPTSFPITSGVDYWVTYNVTNLVAKTFNVFPPSIVNGPLTASGSAFSTPAGTFPNTGSTSNLFADIRFNSPR